MSDETERPPVNAGRLDFLLELEALIREREKTPLRGSYTSALLTGDPRRLAQKLGEEAVELALAAVAGNRQEQLEETADLLYHLLVLLASQDLSLRDAAAVLESRHRS